MVDVIIIGGGAAGLACGIEAVKRGKTCLILEQKEKLGKKLYATGNGKCNFANRNAGLQWFHSIEENTEPLIGNVIHEDICGETEHFFYELGVPAVERQGYLYPRSEQAATVVRALEQAYIQRKGTLNCGERVEKLQWSEQKKEFTVQTDAGVYKSKKIVLATGGMSNSKLGSDGSGYGLAKQLGHSVSTCLPALCGLQCKEKGWNRLQGVRARGTVQAWINHNLLAEELGEIQFTQYGISGIVVFNLSRYASIGLQEGKKVEFVLDLLPEYSKEELKNILVDMQKCCPNRSVYEIVSGFLPDKLAAYLLERIGLQKEQLIRDCQESALKELIQISKCLKVRIVDSNDFNQSQVTAGGVPLSEVNLNTMESKIQSGCYLTGELLDVDGSCGGYNLMWAWSTGRRAGQNL